MKNVPGRQVCSLSNESHVILEVAKKSELFVGLVS